VQTEAIIEVLGYANGHLRPVRLRLRDGSEVTGVPSTVDVDPAALEVFLHPEGDDDTEIGISLAAIISAELV
jgi:hypothetical protein